MRKPRPFENKHAFLCCADDGVVEIDAGQYLTRKEAERLAAWLLKAAEWIREKEGE